ncbi:hypothetical protein [uncultured Mucilaginibacter sp.]|uniref:hypothetical protein n=1 Tax=uncultured Mucilaginibacter sp. TaxID=797541 RepID=UPI0025FB25BF|nr:hypothetical protein [uncultured Mucilaginibacter sp.]
MKLFYTIILSFIILNVFAQETVERSRKLTPGVTERYRVLKSDYSVLNGQYAAYLKKTLIAAGLYDHNQKKATWTFFDKKGKLTQRYNYDRDSLIYEAAPDSNQHIMYIVDDSLNNNPRFTRPIRVGGSYYGFLNYVNLVRLPKDYWSISNDMASVTMELLISPYGRLAEFKVRIKPARPVPYQDDALLNLNIKLLSDEDKVFVPATLNNERVAVRMVIPCRFTGADRLEML